MEPVTLTTERLLLRPLETRDTEAVYTACQDPDIQRWTGVPSPYQYEHARTFIEKIAPDGWRNDTQYPFGVFTTDDDQLVGTIGLVRLALLHTEERQAELGYWTASPQRGHGYTTEAARAVCHWAFTTLGVQRMEWYAEVGNAASRAVALKTGFRMEGTLRARIVHQGVRRDAWIGALLPSDWSLESAAPYLPHPTP
jgi:RimJ/RimL family protein N-acetyltransferase